MNPPLTQTHALAPIAGPDTPAADPRDGEPLGEGRRGFKGVITAVRVQKASPGLDPAELERRLLEMGFVEGARVEILHEGFIRRDPICVSVDERRVALRRCDAGGVFVRPETAR